MDLSIIIVNWNSVDYVQKCIRSIRAQTVAMTYEIIAVDNASYDGCGETLAREYPEVVFLQSHSNLGFAGANNLGARNADGRNFLFLNPDTEVIDGAIDRFYDRFQALTDAGVAGCRLLNTDGSLQASCVQPFPTVMNQVLDADVFQGWFPGAGLWRNAGAFKGKKNPVEVEAVSGACMMIRREVFDRIGGFSPEYFMYTEDLDLCFKTRQAGLRNYYVPGAVIVHHGGGSSQQARSDFSNVMMRESVARFLRKSRGGFYASCYRASMVSAALIRLLLMLALCPVYLVQRRTQPWIASVRKCFAILRWGLGLCGWTRQYHQSAPLPRNAVTLKARR
jgi:GT2 family glycosyltransferase